MLNVKSIWKSFWEFRLKAVKETDDYPKKIKEVCYY